MYEDEEQIDITKLKYVLYARKSTEDETRQIRSIPDQIAECSYLIKQLGLNVVDTLTETKSAKKPGERTVFRQMLNDLSKGKYDGIISWHPDRLARNMREGGEIIDMIDEKQIIDLKFVTHHFTNDATGKMLLGMSFVLSKQYSDDLSQKVTRGVKRNLLEGKSSGTPKHGYVREEGHYRPDGKNFEIVQRAWLMRKEGEHLEVIADSMNEQGYTRMFKEKAKKAGQTMQIDKKIVSKMFKDPFYYGMLVQKGKLVDLREIYDFQPAVSEDDWNAVQQLSNRRLKPTEKTRSIFMPLRHVVVCHYCHKNMVVGAPKGRTKRYLTYRCDYSDCPRIAQGLKRNIRGNVVFDFIYDFLADGLNFTKEEYTQYNDDLMEQLKNRQGELLVKLHSKQGARKATNSEAGRLAVSSVHIKETDPRHKYTLEEMARLNLQVLQLDKDIARLKQLLENPEREKISVEQFLNLSKNAAAKAKAGDVVEKDKLIRMVFLNLELGDEKIASYSLKEPFATLLKNRKVSTGRGERTRTFDLLLPKQAR